MLVHKSIAVRAEIWRKLRLNAELSGVPLRDYLTWLVEQSGPVSESDASARAQLSRTTSLNECARLSPPSGPPST